MKSLLLLALLGLTSAVGCNAIDRASDCSSICSKYKDCLGGSSYDSSACATRCRDYAANSDANDHRVDVCHACTDGTSCAASVFTCAGDCSGVPFN